MKKITKIFICIISIMIFLTGSAIFAYYMISDQGQQIKMDTDIDATVDNVIEVSSLASFVEKGTDTSYNNINHTVSASARKILKLTSDITLSNSFVMTNDIQIDLNGHTLNLNDEILSFKHGFLGCFAIYGGTIERGPNSTGIIILDMPRAGFETNSVTYLANNVATNESATITVLSLDEKYTKYSALFLIANAFSSELSKKPDIMSFSEVSEATLSANLFIPSKTCSYNSDTEEACSFIYKDLDLPNHYLSSDISITYTSSDTTILSNEGKLKGSYGDVNLTVSIDKAGWETLSIVFKLHVVNLSTNSVKASVGLALIKNYLYEYYINSSLVIKEQTVLPDYYYRLNHAVILPATALGGNIEFTYSTTNLSNAANNYVIYKDNAADDAYIFEPSIADYHLVVTIAGTSTSLNMYSTYVGLEETIAYYIANHLYGGSVVYDKASTYKDLYTVDDIENAAAGDHLAELQSYLTSYQISSISYSLKNDVATHYQITNNRLTLQEGALPNDKESYITMSITFASHTYDIDLFVEYLDSNGSTLASYITYYSVYNGMVPSELETNFRMPFSTNNRAPYTCYDVATYTTERIGTGDTAYTRVNSTLNKPINLKVALYYDGVQKVVFTYTAGDLQSFTTQLDAHLTTAGLTLQDIANKTGANEAYYLFSIDAQNSLSENTKLVLIYNYKFEASATNWSRYVHTNSELTDNNTTYFTVLGGLFYNTSGTNAAGTAVDYAVKNGNFFVWIYNRFRPNTTGYEDISSASSDRIIPIDWLGQEVIITKDDTDLSTVTDFSGIKYLKSVTEVDLSGGTVSTNVLNGISEMKSLKTLILSNCSLQDISSLSKLAAQNTLKVLDISNNSIQYFDGITTITSLEKVYVYNNNQTNKYYGSKGICNFQAFADLMLNGCSVYNDISNSVPVLYAESNNLDDYRRLKEIAYQQYLKSGVSITLLYTNEDLTKNEFDSIGSSSTNVNGDNRPGNNPFGLQSQGTIDWGYQGDTNEGTKYLEASVTTGGAISGTYYELSNGTYSQTTDTTFIDGKTYYQVITDLNATYFYVTFTYQSGYILKVKYYVDRF